jgi:hypothetical protein
MNKRPTNESARLVGGWWGRRGGWRKQKCHQRVAKTRWWSRWAARLVERKKDPPTSLRDSLVVGGAGGVGGGSRNATNESLRLVGGHGGRQGWWRGKRPTNESRRLVGGQRGRRGGWRKQKCHQRVLTTRWWSYWPAVWVE